jgi:channel protein (hemolysin III family)
MILLFSVSAAYHWLPAGRTKDVLRRLDHAAIFLFIAGSYTPFVLGTLAEEGYGFLATVWLIATVGTDRQVRQPPHASRAVDGVLPGTRMAVGLHPASHS